MKDGNPIHGASPLLLLTFAQRESATGKVELVAVEPYRWVHICQNALSAISSSHGMYGKIPYSQPIKRKKTVQNEEELIYVGVPRGRRSIHIPPPPLYHFRASSQMYLRCGTMRDVGFARLSRDQLSHHPSGVLFPCLLFLLPDVSFSTLLQKWLCSGAPTAVRDREHSLPRLHHTPTFQVTFEKKKVKKKRKLKV